MNEANVDIWLEGCRKQDSECQRLLYRHFYNYGLTIGLRYAPSRDEAREILNDAFVKVFSRIDRYAGQGPFKIWLGRVIVNTAIDRYRAACRAQAMEASDDAAPIECAPSALDYLYHEDLIKLVQQLPPSYRIVFNLHVVEGYTHEEIAEMLDIQTGTSKSNLAKAKEKLKRLIYRLPFTLNRTRFYATAAGLVRSRVHQYRNFHFENYGGPPFDVEDRLKEKSGIYWSGWNAKLLATHQMTPRLGLTGALEGRWPSGAVPKVIPFTLGLHVGLRWKLGT